MTDQGEIPTFDEKLISRPWAVSPDSDLLICQQSTMTSYRVPTMERVTPPGQITVPSIRSWAAAWAWEAPIIAFGTDDSVLRWFKLVEAKADAAG